MKKILRLPEIPDPAYEVERPVPHGYESIFTEKYCFCSVCGFCEFSKDYPSHAGLKCSKIFSHILWLAVLPE